ncbi:ABC-type dipeptide transport system, periplasmic component [Corynebacterium kutscheri]|uniref:ABC-type dipeptide transport system, periplasmic component n=1 Tax=Corynebacterium kutscheri TaxID=35755 RepID=A0A0F6TEF0_9CORY|nr:ABC transporter substrate-binding protein [Corynebacterium kutscheri]AKE41964.1 ABC-type dipeptide transport system, periplasmic component [Corynebacterium kutscheri]VEH10305.1 putative transport system secreted protein [Corynebacterium kutscheri]
MANVSRRNFLRMTGVIGAAAGLSATVAACAPDNQSGSSAGSTGGSAGTVNEDGTITAAISYELGTNGYDPMTTTAALTVAVNWHIFEGLTEIDPVTGKAYAGLAKTLPQPEGTTFDVSLRDGAKFHDGSEVTAEDVVYSFERVLDPENKSLYASFIPFIEKVEAKDDTTVTFTLAYPVGVVADRLSVVKIVPKAIVEKDLDAFDALPTGTGPYRLTDNGGTSKTIAFERFDDYSGERPARAKKMQWQIIPDASTRINSLQSGLSQAVDSVPYLSIDQLKTTSMVESVQGFGLLFAMFNNRTSNPMGNVLARQAFLYAVDIDTVVKTAMSDQATPATSFLPESHPNYSRATTVYSFDVDKAREMFSEAGVTKIRMMCTDHDWVKACTPLIHESVQKAGVEVEFTERKSADLYNFVDSNPGEWDVAIAPGDPSVFGQDPNLLMSWWYAGDTWTDTRMGWKGQESYQKMQELLSKGLESTDTSAQQDAWDEAFDLISETVPLYPLFHRKTPTGWNADTLVDFKPISVTGLSFVGVGTTEG